MSKHFQDIGEYLEFLAYEIKDIGDDGKEAYLAEHDDQPSFFFSDQIGGVLLTCPFPVGPEDEEFRSAISEPLNALNEGALVSRFYAKDDGKIMQEAWWPDFYERKLFGTFMERWQDDNDKLQDMLEQLAEFLEG